MKRVVGVIAFLVLVGLMSVPASAAELRVTGFFDNILPHVDHNLSQRDSDATSNHDNIFWGRERSQFFFNFIASDDLRGVFGIEIDQSYGTPRTDPVGSRCTTDERQTATVPTTTPGQTATVLTQQFNQCGFRNGIDNNAIEIKHLYVDFRIPQLPIGNRWLIGGFPLEVTPLHDHLLLGMDVGGGQARFDFTDQVSVQANYVQWQENLDTFPGVSPASIGEDFTTGLTVLTKPLPGLDFHLIGQFGHLGAPASGIWPIDITGQAPGQSGPFNNIRGDPTSVATEDRYYLGFDSRYRLGDLSIEPTYIHLLGTRKFQSASQAVTGVQSVKFNAYQTQLRLQYTRGPWFLGLKGNYASGNKAGDDINNAQIPGAFGTRRSDVKGFRPLAIDGFHNFGEWLEMLGRQEVDGVGTSQGPVAPGERGAFDRFGKIGVQGKAEYQATDVLVLEAAAGSVWAAQMPRCPAVFRRANPADPRGFDCAATTVAGGAPVQNPLTTNLGTPALDFAGTSTYMGTEIDVGMRYTIMPGLIWQTRFGWAFLGDALLTVPAQREGRHVQDSYIFINRLLYTF